MVAATTVVEILARILSDMATSTSKTNFINQVSCQRFQDHSHLYLPFIAGAAMLCCMGGMFRKLCYRSLGRMYTFEITILPSHQLVTTGPYSVVRHPGYASAILVQIGLQLLLYAPGTFFTECVAKGAYPYFGYVWRLPITAFSLLQILWWFWRTGREDSLMKTTFGPEWDRYASKTRYRLVPYIV